MGAVVSRVVGVRGVLAGVLLALVLVGVSPADDAPAVKGDADGLKSVWTEILTKAAKTDEQTVKDISATLTKMVMDEADFIALFGDEKGKPLYKLYAERYAKVWPNEAKNIVDKVSKRGYDEAEVVDVTATPEQQSAGDKQVVKQLKPGVKMYTVRLKKKSEKTGLVYNSFFFVNGAWKTGLKLSKLKEE